MFVLKKMFQLRDDANPDAEKPFLEHLEDLRVMITKIVITLTLSTLVCFTARNTLMEVIRKPIDEVWVMKLQSTLPEEITIDQWEKALALSHVAPALSRDFPELADSWWEMIDPDRTVRALSRAAVLYRAVHSLPEDAQTPYLDQLQETYPTEVAAARELLERGASIKLSSSGNLRMMSALKPTETFMLTMKLAFFAGITLSFPFLLYFILQFVLPGLKEEERKALWPAMAIGFGLFLGGVCFAYFFVLPKVLVFFYEWSAGLNVENDWRIGYYISFATTFVLVFGLAFELPVVVMTLVHLGILGHSMMRDTRSYAIVAIMVIAALITPTPDIPTLLLLAGPMYLLYELCIWLSYFKEKKQEARELKEEKEYMSRLLAHPSPEDEDDHAAAHAEEDFDDGDPITDDDHHPDDDYLDYPGEHQDPDHDPRP